MAVESDKDTKGATCGCGGGPCCSGLGKWILLALAVAVVAVLVAKKAGPRTPAAGAGAGEAGVASQTEALPRLVDLGATKCIPCKMMAPILEELKKTYAGKMDVQFIDVWENPDAAKKYGISVIPTQIFYDAGGRELFRHEGFFGREDILAKWKDFGVDLAAATATAVPPVSR